MAIDPSAQIHETAVIAPQAEIGPLCKIGPFCVIEGDVRLGEGVELKSHVALAGDTHIGAHTIIFPFASIGHIPQDLKFAGEKTQLRIGARNRIREHVTMNPGTAGGGGLTKVGDDGLFMMGVHVGHDCIIGNRVIMANNASLGGHCRIDDHVVIGALAGVHQFCRIGRGAMIGGLSAVVGDVIPYGTVIGERAHLGGLNLVGLKRAHVPRAQIHELRAAFRALFEGEGALRARAEAYEPPEDNPLVAELVSFVLGATDRSFTMPHARADEG